MRTPVLCVVAAAVAVGVVGCSSGSTPVATSPTPTPVTSSPAAPSPSDQLQALATKAVRIGLSATYAATPAAKGARPATWRVWRTRTALRVDVITRAQRATLITSPAGTFGCLAARHSRSCFRLPRNASVPAALRLQAQSLFSADLAALARDVTSYEVSAAPPRGNDRCYGLRTPSGVQPVITAGVYCFTPVGVVASIVFQTGSTVRLRSVMVHAPAKATFRPYSSPTPLPH